MPVSVNENGGAQARSGCRRSLGLRGEAEALPVPVHHHMIVVSDFVGQQLTSQLGFDFFLQQPLERSRPVARVVAGLGKVIPGRLGQVQADMPLGQASPQPFELDIDNRLEVVTRQTVEDDRLVNPVEELRRNCWRSASSTSRRMCS